MARYAGALAADLSAVAQAGPAGCGPPGTPQGPWPPLASVFVGGGTPTLLPAAALAELLGHARAVLPVRADAEVTVEANPETVEADGLATLVAAGLTRLSIGAQAFAADTLAFLDRRHDPASVGRAVAAARSAGVASINLDLIFGVPGQDAAAWQATLEQALALEVDHLSCYALTLERNTPYFRAVAQQRQPAPEEEVAAERMAAAARTLAAAGFERYEVSNWARPGHACVHNLSCWRGGDYLAVGAGAHGHWRGRRWWRVRSTERYVARVHAGAHPDGGQELLSAAERRAERLALGLRTAEGVPRSAVEPAADRMLARLLDAGLLSADGGRVAVTAQGWALADGIAAALLPTEAVPAGP